MSKAKVSDILSEIFKKIGSKENTKEVGLLGYGKKIIITIDLVNIEITISKRVFLSDAFFFSAFLQKKHLVTENFEISP